MVGMESLAYTMFPLRPEQASPLPYILDVEKLINRPRQDKMPATETPASLIRTNLEFKSYSEDSDFEPKGKPGLNSRSQALIYHLHDKKRWIKVTFKGTIPSVSQSPTGANQIKCERRNEFQNLCTMTHLSRVVLES
ncbi:hypothetical protein N7468_008280 [Penicillium chermesinum]|uniref:Uncharacterized protein n=1 Tax=Penicillium chermesinum TaxID=63820 RepID=A0A9W9NPW7_9EURO|nr:uncharacterized protein N7468_008280 [Penicillium chermesinum]KAJ5223738.1 hypothetical protein N7468_008280 [Penicillium chermesinum]